MSYSSIESAKAIVKTSDLPETESLVANEVILSLQPLSSFNSKLVKPANPIPIFNPITIDNFSNYGKPNAIVRPVVRNTEISDMTTPKLNEEIIPLSSQVNVLKQDNTGRNKKKEIDLYARKLDVKLKPLTSDKKNSQKNVKIIVLISCIIFIPKWVGISKCVI